jgi:hypothetical protein
MVGETIVWEPADTEVSAAYCSVSTSIQSYGSLAACRVVYADGLLSQRPTAAAPLRIFSRKWFLRTAAAAEELCVDKSLCRE